MTFACLIKIKTQPDENSLCTTTATLSKELAKVFDPCLALLHTPSTTEDKYTKDGVSPYSIIELHTEDLHTLEKNIPLIKNMLAAININVEPIIQVMLAREFDTQTGSGSSLKNMFSYFVEYAGKTDSDTAWTNHYIKNHAAIMTRMPKIEAIFVYTAVMWLYPDQTQRFESLLCNRVSFPVQSDLESALNSPIRDELREDYESFPRFDGTCTHFAMDTTVLIDKGRQ